MYTTHGTETRAQQFCRCAYIYIVTQHTHLQSRVLLASARVQGTTQNERTNECIRDRARRMDRRPYVCCCCCFICLRAITSPATHCLVGFCTHIALCIAHSTLHIAYAQGIFALASLTNSLTCSLARSLNSTSTNPHCEHHQLHPIAPTARTDYAHPNIIILGPFIDNGRFRQNSLQFSAA